MRYLLLRNSQLANVDRRGQALPGYTPAYRHVPGRTMNEQVEFGLIAFIFNGKVTTSEKRPDLAKVSDSKKAKLCSICWTSNPLKRPSASQLKRQIQALNFEENSLKLTVEKNSSNLSQRRNSLRI